MLRNLGSYQVPCTRITISTAARLTGSDDHVQEVSACAR